MTIFIRFFDHEIEIKIKMKNDFIQLDFKSTYLSTFYKLESY